MANVIPFPNAKGETTAVDLFLRVGEASYVQIEKLYGEGRLPIRRAIFDASKVRHQVNFLKTLQEDGVERILDTKAAELAALGKFKGRAKEAPWADGTSLHLPDQFDDKRCGEFVAEIAREAIARDFDRVLAPAHFLRNAVLDPWFQVDLRLCRLLREALDREGGAHIAIDYPLILEQMKLRDEDVRGALIHQLNSLPFENLLIRASRFGSDAEAPGTRAFIQALDRFHNLGRPIIADHVGGIVGRSLIAFGAASGVAHGVDETMRFDGGSWWKEPEAPKDNEQRAGPAKRVSVPMLDKHLKVDELTALAKARGGHGLVVCNDPNCCRSLTDMINNSKRHSFRQEKLAYDHLNRIPDLMRARDFIDKELAEADRFARQVKELKPIQSELKVREGQSAEAAAANLTTRLAKQSLRIEKLRSSLENLHTVRGLDAPRAPAARTSPRILDKNRKH